jgi:hypothetical protein
MRKNYFPKFGPFSPLSVSNRPKFSRSFVWLLGPFWVMQPNNRWVGNTASQLERTLQLCKWLVDIVKGGGRAPPNHLTITGLIFPSWWNVRQKVAIASLVYTLSFISPYPLLCLQSKKSLLRSWLLICFKKLKDEKTVFYSFIYSTCKNFSLNFYLSKNLIMKPSLSSTVGFPSSGGGSGAVLPSWWYTYYNQQTGTAAGPMLCGAPYCRHRQAWRHCPSSLNSSLHNNKCFN